MFMLLPLVGVWLLGVISPGPDFLVTVQYASARSRRHGIAVGLGVSCAILVWSVGSLLGLAVLLAQVSWLYDVVRYAGSGYLVYLGVRALWASRRREPAANAGTGDDRVDAGPDRHPGGLLRAWRVGFLTNIGNPKAAVFFTSLFGALLPASAGLGLRGVAVALMVTIACCWFTAVAVLFGLAPVARAYRRAHRWIDRATGTVLVALGLRLALEG